MPYASENEAISGVATTSSSCAVRHSSSVSRPEPEPVSTTSRSALSSAVPSERSSSSRR